MWLTEFSPVWDWNNARNHRSEDDDFNFLAEFMWQAEGQDWLKRYAIRPFSGTNSASPWVDNGYRGNLFSGRWRHAFPAYGLNFVRYSCGWRFPAFLWTPAPRISSTTWVPVSD